MWVGRSRNKSLWRNREYVLLWSGQTVSAIGSQFSGFVLPLLVLVLTNSAAQAGLIGALEGLPYLILSVPAGILIDRWNRKAVMIVCECSRGINMVSIPAAFAVGHVYVPQLYVVALIEGTLFVFFNLAETSSLARIVPSEQLPSALAQQELTWGISALAGPTLAGALYSVVSAAFPFLVDAISYAISALSLFRMRAAFQMPRAAPTGNLVTGIREALHWLWHQPLLRALALLSAAGDFLFSGIGLIPMVIAQQQMHASPVAIGLIFTFAAIGGIVGSFFSSWVQRRLTLGQAVIGSEWATSLLFPLLLVAPNPLGLGLVRTLLSTTVSVSNPIRLNYQLAVTPDRLQGRVNSLTALIA